MSFTPGQELDLESQGHDPLRVVWVRFGDYAGTSVVTLNGAPIETYTSGLSAIEPPQPSTGWISASTPPDSRRDVLTVDKFDNCWVGYYMTGWCVPETVDGNYPVRWHELPALPEGA